MRTFSEDSNAPSPDSLQRHPHILRGGVSRHQSRVSVKGGVYGAVEITAILYRINLNQRVCSCQGVRLNRQEGKISVLAVASEGYRPVEATLVVWPRTLDLYDICGVSMVCFGSYSSVLIRSCRF